MVTILAGHATKRKAAQRREVGPVVSRQPGGCICLIRTGGKRLKFHEGKKPNSNPGFKEKIFTKHNPRPPRHSPAHSEPSAERAG